MASSTVDVSTVEGDRMTTGARKTVKGARWRMRTLGPVVLALVGTAGLIFAAPGPGVGQSAGSSAKIVLHGAGATFPAPLYKKWIGEFSAQNPDVVIEYRDVGSGEGVKRFLDQSVDFGASDGALTDEQLAHGGRLVPTTAGIVVLAYNTPGLGGDLKLSRDVYTDVFLRKIEKWNDPRLQAINPGLKLPNRSIAIAARQDGSGTTFALSNHLSTISPAWRDGPGIGYMIDWGGRAMRARGNEGVAALIKIGEGTMGYVEYGFARRLGLSMASLQNKAGQYVAPSDRSGQAALAGNVKQMPDNLRLYVPDPDGADSYPIVSLSWLLVYDRYADQQKSAALKRFLTWGLSSGQSYSSELGYIALPPEITSLSKAALARIE
jgi:phosphate transport system substrate-binding protein